MPERRPVPVEAEGLARCARGTLSVKLLLWQPRPGTVHFAGRVRKTVVEAVFGWVKQVLGFRGFLLRGARKVKGEWNLVCLAMNLRRIGKSLAW